MVRLLAVPVTYVVTLFVAAPPVKHVVILPAAAPSLVVSCPDCLSARLPCSLSVRASWPVRFSFIQKSLTLDCCGAYMSLFVYCAVHYYNLIRCHCSASTLDCDILHLMFRL